MAADQHVRAHSLSQPGSKDLRTLLSRGVQSRVALANETSVGVGHAPLNRLERLVLAIEKRANGRDRCRGPVTHVGIRRARHR